MKRIIRVISCIILFLSILKLSCIPRIILSLSEQWETLEAEITFIGIPGGSIFGNYTDGNHVFHENVLLYSDGRFQGFIGAKKNPEPYYGTTVTILHNKQTDEIVGYDEALEELTKGTIGVVIVVVLFCLTENGERKRIKEERKRQEERNQKSMQMLEKLEEVSDYEWTDEEKCVFEKSSK